MHGSSCCQLQIIYVSYNVSLHCELTMWACSVNLQCELTGLKLASVGIVPCDGKLALLSSKTVVGQGATQAMCSGVHCRPQHVGNRWSIYLTIKFEFKKEKSNFSSKLTETVIWVGTMNMWIFTTERLRSSWLYGVYLYKTRLASQLVGRGWAFPWQSRFSLNMFIM